MLAPASANRALLFARNYVAMPIAQPCIVRAALLFAAACAASSAVADVYKCKGDGNVPMYQETPCPSGRELRDFQFDPPDITVLPGSTGGAAGRAAANPPGAARPPKHGTGAREGKPAQVMADAAERRHLRSGMTAAEVRLRVGAPDGTASMKRTKSERWTYQPAAGDPETITSVTLVDGVVTGVERTVVKK